MAAVTAPVETSQDQRTNDPADMWHISRADNEDVALCGMILTGDFGDEDTEAECVVCAELWEQT